MKRYIIYISAALAAISIQAGAQEVATDSLGRGLGVYTNPAMLLQGQVSGVRVSPTDGAVGGQVNTNIRGLNTVRGSSEPLWIVDGAILTSSGGDTYQAFADYGNSSFTAPVSQLDGINIYDIESIEVLKNTTATALYGSRGANGVIIIKTRRPTSEKMTIDLNTNVGIATPSGFAHNHSLSLGARTGRTNYRISAFYRDHKGVLKTNGDKAFGVRVLFETQSNKVVWFGLNTAFTIGEINSATGVARYGSPSATLAYREIAPLPYYDKAGVSSLEGWNSDFDDLTKAIRSTSNFYLTLNFTKSLRWKNSLSFDMQDINRGIWYGNGTAFGKTVNGAAGVNYASIFTLGFKSELSFDRYFAGKHHFKALGAFEYIADWNKYNVMCGTNFFMHDMRVNGFNLKESETKIRYFSPDINSIGGHLHLVYEFGKYAGIDAVARYETTPRYDSGSAVMDNVYPAASGWIDIRNIAFADSKAVSTLRLEGGWGKAGRSRAIPYEMLPFYAGSYPSVGADLRGYYEGFNRVRSNEWHVSLNAGFLSDRINAGLTYYDKRTDDNLTVYCFGKESTKEKGIWEVTDRYSIQEQACSIANRGFELSLSATPVKTGKASWTIGITSAYNINRLMKVSAADSKGLILNADGLYANVNKEGESVNSLYGFTVNQDNVVNGEGLLGNTLPKFNGGFNTELKIGGFRLELLGNAALGFNVLNMNRMLASAKIDTYMGESVAQPYVEKGDFFRLTKATAGYTIPIKASWIKTLDVNVTATNLFTLTRYNGLNPEVSTFGFTNLAGGIDYGSYPLARFIMLGVTAKF